MSDKTQPCGCKVCDCGFKNGEKVKFPDWG